MIRRRLVYNKVDLANRDWKFYVALATAALITILFYYFVIGFRELYRHAAVRDYPEFINLSPLKHSLYDLFFAFLSTIVGFMVFTKMWVPANLTVSPFIRGRVLLDQQYVPGMFIYLFLKLGMMLGFLFAGFGIFHFMDVGKELWPLFVVAPIFLFLHQWMALRLRVKQATMKVMLSAFAGQLIFASVLVLIPFHDFSKLDEMSLRRSPADMLRLNLPNSYLAGFAASHHSFAKMHVGFRKDNGEVAMSFGDFRSDFIMTDELVTNRFIAAQRDFYNWDNTIFRNPVVNLYADRDVPAATIIEIMKRMKEKGEVFYNLIANDANGRSGVPIGVGGYCHDVGNKLKLEYWLANDRGDTTWFYQHGPCPTVEYYKDHEIFKLSFNNNRITLEDTLRGKGDLYDWAYRRMVDQYKNAGKKTFIIPVVDNLTSYGTYFGAYEEVWHALIDVRTQKSRDSAIRDEPDIPFDRFKWETVGDHEKDIYDDLYARLKKTQNKN